MIEPIKAYFEEHPAYFGLVIIALGIILLCLILKIGLSLYQANQPAQSGANWQS